MQTGRAIHHHALLIVTGVIILSALTALSAVAGTNGHGLNLIYWPRRRSSR